MRAAVGIPKVNKRKHKEIKEKNNLGCTHLRYGRTLEGNLGWLSQTALWIEKVVFIFACIQQENHYSFLQNYEQKLPTSSQTAGIFNWKWNFKVKKDTAAPCQNILDSSKNNTDFSLSKENKKFHWFAQKLFTVYRERWELSRAVFILLTQAVWRWLNGHILSLAEIRSYISVPSAWHIFVIFCSANSSFLHQFL